jgi:multiple sugar transport system substrate-binding protein
MRELIPEFTKETGIAVNMELYGEDQLSQKLSVELVAGSTMDVFMPRPLNESRLFMKNGFLEDLTPYIKADKEFDWADFTQGSIECTNIDGFQTCVPITVECQLLYYRKDLFEAKGVKIPETYEELEAAAEKLTDRSRDISGILMRGMKSPAITQFSTFLYGFGGNWYDQKTYKATMDTPEALAAIDFYGRLLRKYGPPGSPNMSWPQMMAVFQQGKGAMYIDASAHFPMLLDPTKSSMAELTGITIVPAGPAGRKVFDICAQGLSIYSGSKNKDASWKFISFMVSKDKVAQMQGKYGIQSARKSAYENPEGTKAFPADFLEAVKKSAQFGVGYDRPLMIQVQEARDILGTAIVVSEEGGDYRKAALEANKKFQELLDREPRLK